jgi:hypothetical protein
MRQQDLEKDTDKLGRCLAEKNRMGNEKYPQKWQASQEDLAKGRAWQF